MRFGSREICDVVFKATTATQIGSKLFKKGQPVLYIDTAKTSTLEGAATTVYAQGGKGNSRLIAWEGEKTLTFTVEDALLSPMGFAVLSGAGIIRGKDNTSNKVHVHRTTSTTVNTQKVTSGEGDSATTSTKVYIDLSDALATGEEIDSTAPVFIMIAQEDGSIEGDAIYGAQVTSAFSYLGTEGASAAKTLLSLPDTAEVGDASSAYNGTSSIKTASYEAGTTVFVDYYVAKSQANIDEMQIDAENFAGYYYVEASTLFRRQSDGKDLPAEIILPNVKIQSNFTFQMSSTGDPSTFTFTMDAFPGYTMFDKTKKVLCVMQVIDDTIANNTNTKSVLGHTTDSSFVDVTYDDSTLPYGDGTTYNATTGEKN